MLFVFTAIALVATAPVAQFNTLSIETTANGLATPIIEQKVGGVLGFAEGVVHGGEGLVRGVVNTVVHPINTIKGTASAIIHPIKTVKAVSQNFKEECKDKGKAECAGKAVFNVGTAVVAPIGVAKLSGALGKASAVEESFQPLQVRGSSPPLPPPFGSVPLVASRFGDTASVNEILVPGSLGIPRIVVTPPLLDTAEEEAQLAIAKQNSIDTHNAEFEFNGGSDLLEDRRLVPDQSGVGLRMAHGVV